MSVGLIVIDIQNDYFQNGKMELEGSEDAGQAAGRLLNFCREYKLPVFHIQHIAIRPGATFFLPNSAGVEIHRSVKPLDEETVIQKHFPNSFRETGLLQHLQRKNIQQLVVAGMMTHMCVDSTTRAARDLGYQPIVIADATATKNLEFQEKEVSAQQVQISFLSALQNFAQIQATHTFLW